MTTPTVSADAGTGKDPVPPSCKLRWMFLCVSAVLLALLLASSAFAVRFLAQIRSQELAASRALADRTNALAGLWLALQNYDQAVQQFVAQTAANQAAEQRRVDQLTREINSDFDHFPILGDPEEAAMLNELRGMFSQQRTLYVTIVEAPPAQRKREADKLLANQLAPAEKQIMDWSGRLQAWSGERLQQADRDLTGKFGKLRAALRACSASASAAVCCWCSAAWGTS